MSLNTAETIGWLALALLFICLGVGLAYVLWRAGRLVRRLDGSLHDVVDSGVPLLGKVGVSIDSVNDQLQKVDHMMDSAVAATDSVDATVRAVSATVAQPVRKASAFVAGMGETASSFRDRFVADDPSAPRAAGTADQPAADGSANDDATAPSGAAE